MPKFLRFYLVLWVINVGDVGVFYTYRKLYRYVGVYGIYPYYSYELQILPTAYMKR